MTPPTKAWCACCGHSRALHLPTGKHLCVLDDCPCSGYVSETEAQEIARIIREALREAARGEGVAR
jgi:hypothetical protein